MDSLFENVAIAHPWRLLLLGLLPLVFWWRRDSLAGLGRWRSRFAVSLRVVILSILILALAGLELVQWSRRSCTIFVVDQSYSVLNSPGQKWKLPLEQIGHAAGAKLQNQDMVGLIAFGKEAHVEVPPTNVVNDRTLLTLERSLSRDGSSLASGLRLAQGLFPPDCRRRIVLISDGNQNRDDVLAEAANARRNETPVDVIPVEYRYDSEVLVEELSLPAESKEGDTAPLKVILRSVQPASGKLRLDRIAGGKRETILEQPVSLRAGVNVFYVNQKNTTPGFFTYEATFEPSTPGSDPLAANNRSHGFTWVRGRSRILLVTGFATKASDYQLFVDTLRGENMEVTIVPPDGIPGDLGVLTSFDSIVLNNVASDELGDDRQRLLLTLVKDLGCGLLVVGGDRSFGAGGYDGAPLEEGLPVRCSIDSRILSLSVAVVLVIDHSGSMSGIPIQMAKRSAQIAVDLLGPNDQLGVLAFDDGFDWTVPLGPLTDKAAAQAAISRLTADGGTVLYPALEEAARALEKVKANSKHVIILSDGQSVPGQFLELVRSMVKNRISVSSVGIGSGADQRLLESLARVGKGRYYFALDASGLPKIYLRELRRISRPVLFEKPEAWSPRIVYPSEMVTGMPQELAPIRGLILTTPKPTAEVIATSPLPPEIPVNPLLASWQFGLGRVVVFTSDLGSKWTSAWPASGIYPKFWSQVVRSSMRTTNADSGLTITTQRNGDQVEVVVNALDAEGGYQNQLNVKGMVISPDMKTSDLSLRQTGPGKYVGSFPVAESGSYLIRLGSTDSKRQDVQTAAVSVSYPLEYRELSSDLDLLENVAAVTGGRYLDDSRSWDKTLDDTRPPLANRLPFWPTLLLVALLLFWLDVAVRRISIDFAEMRTRVAQWWKRPPTPDASSLATLSRLKNTKVEVNKDLADRRSLREALPSETRDGAIDRSGTSRPSPPRSPSATKPGANTAPKPASPPSAPSDATDEGDSPMGRLLRAKKEIQRSFDRDRTDES